VLGGTKYFQIQKTNWYLSEGPGRATATAGASP